VNEPSHSRLATGVDHVARALHVQALEVRRVAPVLDLRRGVERELGTLRAGGERVAVVEIAADRLGAALTDARRGAVRAGQRADVPALARQPLDKRPAHEARAACHERGGHLSARREGRSRTRRPP
jgi:hypothetical protein